MTVRFLTSMLQPGLMVHLKSGDFFIQDRRARWYQNEDAPYAESKVIDFEFSKSGAAIIIDIEL